MSERVMISDDMLDALREALRADRDSGRMSEKRFRHTVEVEKMAARLAALYIPEKEDILRAAALLHDITKECSFDEHLKICRSGGIILSEYDTSAPKTLHAMSATVKIEKEMPEYDVDEVKSCVRWHTTGRGGMTLCEKLIYLADYIDMSRMFEDCVKLREYFFGKDIAAMSEQQKKEHLDDTLILSYYMTVKALTESGKIISPHTTDARNELLLQRLKRNR